MAEALKILGQSGPAANNLVNLYAVPADKSAVVSSLIICNTTASAATVRVYAQAGGGISPTTANSLFYDLPVAANETITLTLGITLAATDAVSVRSTVFGVTFTAFGSEVT